MHTRTISSTMARRSLPGILDPHAFPFEMLYNQKSQYWYILLQLRVLHGRLCDNLSGYMDGYYESSSTCSSTTTTGTGCCRNCCVKAWHCACKAGNSCTCWNRDKTRAWFELVSCCNKCFHKESASAAVPSLSWSMLSPAYCCCLFKFLSHVDDDNGDKCYSNHCVIQCATRTLGQMWWMDMTCDGIPQVITDFLAVPRIARVRMPHSSRRYSKDPRQFERLPRPVDTRRPKSEGNLPPWEYRYYRHHAYPTRPPCIHRHYRHHYRVQTHRLQ